MPQKKGEKKKEKKASLAQMLDQLFTYEISRKQ